MTDAERWYAWVDLETTGTREHADQILEVGIALSREDWQPVMQFERVVRCSQLAREMAPGRVREMHDANGLWVASKAATMDIDRADYEINHWLLEATKEQPRKQLILSGSGVGHFDSRFIRAQLPLFAGWLTWWTMDVGVVRRFLRTCGIEIAETETDKPHRALADALYHMEEGRRYRVGVEEAVAALNEKAAAAFKELQIARDNMPPLMRGRAGNEDRGPVGF